MHGRWRFRIVDLDLGGSYVKRDGAPLELQGTDVEALAKAKELVNGHVHDISHIQAVSVGCPMAITDTPGRLLVFVAGRFDGKGWMLTGDMMHGSWHRSLSDAVSYGAFRTTGHDSETRIISTKAVVTHVVLIPSNGQRMTLY